MAELDLETTFREARELALRFVVLLRRSLKRWFLLLLGVAAGAVAAWQAPKLVPPLYRSQSLLMYRETLQTESLLGAQDSRETWAQMSKRFIDVMLSRSTLEATITKFDLYPRLRAREGMVAAVEEMRRNTDIRAPQGSVVYVSHTGTAPGKVFAVTQHLVDLMKQQPGRDAAARAEGTRSFLAAQLEVIKQDLQAREEALAGFLTLNPEFALEDMAAGGARVGVTIRAAERRGTPGGGRSARLQALTRQAHRLARQLSDPAEDPVPPTTEAPPTPVSAPPPAISVEDQQRIAAAERAVLDRTQTLKALRQQFTEIHPDVVAARKDLDRARAELAQVKSSARLVAQPLPPKPTAPAPAPSPADDRDGIEKRLRGINDAIAMEKLNEDSDRGPAENAVASVVALEMRWVALNREVDSMREQYEAVEKRLFQAATLARVESSGGRGEIITIDPPYEPLLPAARGPRRTALMAFGACLLGALAVAFGLTLLDDRLRDEYELRSLKLGRFTQTIPWYEAEEEHG